LWRPEGRLLHWQERVSHDQRTKAKPKGRTQKNPRIIAERRTPKGRTKIGKPVNSNIVVACKRMGRGKKKTILKGIKGGQGETRKLKKSSQILKQKKTKGGK